MKKEAIKALKWDYNYYLARYYKGCNYCKEHIDKIDRWLPNLLDIMENINVLLAEIKKYEKVSNEEILGGFKI